MIFDILLLRLSSNYMFYSLLCTCREKNFDEFSKHLKGLVNLYNLPGDK